MKEYKKTQSTIRPEPLVIDEFSAWVCENITEVDEGFEYDMMQYSKDEYIKIIAEENSQLKTDQQSLSDAVAELILGGM